MTAEHNSIPPLVGGHPVLDLVNTVEPRAAVADRMERLSQPDDLLAWALRAGVVDAAEADAVRAAWNASPVSATQALAAAIELREAAYTLLAPHAEHYVPTEDRNTCLALEVLALRRAAAAARTELVLNKAEPLPNQAEPVPNQAEPVLNKAELGPSKEDRRAARLMVGTMPAMMIPDRLATAAVELICGADLSNLRACPLDEGGCGWLFFDRSRNRSRRWCVMADCGAQVKAKRLTERRRTQRATAVFR
jgi:predicted RNA-binding Zn ribbon-like protein